MPATTGALFSPDDSVSILINTFVQSLKPVYTILIITCIWSAMLVPLLITLLFLSDKEMRRKPIFFGNLFAITLGIAHAVVVLELTVSKWLHPWMAFLHSRGTTDVHRAGVCPLGPAGSTKHTSLPHILKPHILRSTPRRICPRPSSMGRLSLPVHPTSGIFCHIHPYHPSQDRPSRQHHHLPG